MGFFRRKKKKVVIVGGGFGGVILAKELLGKVPHMFSVTLIDKKDYHLFQPALINAAATFKTPSEIFTAVAIRFKDIFGSKNIEVINKEVQDVLFDDDRIVLGGVMKNKEFIDYDYLVLSPGAETDFKDISDAEKYSMPLKTFEDALMIKSRLEDLFKHTAKKEKINIVIAGAGFTGISFLFEVVSYARKLAEIYGHPHDLLGFKIVEAGDKIIPEAGDWLRGKAIERLKALKAEILLKSQIQSVEENCLILKSGVGVNYSALIWSLGVKPLSLPCCKNLSCSDTLRPGNQKNVFVLGDVICGSTFSAGGKTVATAYLAINQAKYVAKAIIRLNMFLAPLLFLRKRGSLPLYKVPKPKFAVSFGEDYGAVDLGFLKVSGKWGIHLKHLIFLNYFSRILPWRKAFEFYEKYLSL